MTLSDQINRTGPAIDRINDAIRQNPLAAGLIGAGALWMLFGNRNLGGVRRMARATGSGVASAVTATGAAASQAGGVIADMGASAVRSAREGVTSAVEAVSSTIAGGGDGAIRAESDGASWPETAGAEVAGATESAKAFAASSVDQIGAATTRLSELLREQPLLLGGIGLAIGAGIASTFASTRMEGEWVGDAGARARAKLKDVMDTVSGEVGRISREVEEDAADHGLSVEGAREAWDDVADKAAKVAGRVAGSGDSSPQSQQANSPGWG
jgi:hypothetical protein